MSFLFCFVFVFGFSVEVYRTVFVLFIGCFFLRRDSLSAFCLPTKTFLLLYCSLDLLAFRLSRYGTGSRDPRHRGFSLCRNREISQLFAGTFERALRQLSLRLHRPFTNAFLPSRERLSAIDRNDRRHRYSLVERAFPFQ